MSREVENVVNELIEVIKQSDMYADYKEAQERVKDSPDAIDKINEIRALNLQLQSIQNSDQAYDVQEKLAKRFDELSEDQRVFDFIEAENKFIGVYQELHRKVLEQFILI